MAVMGIDIDGTFIVTVLGAIGIVSMLYRISKQLGALGEGFRFLESDLSDHELRLRTLEKRTPVSGG
jgi:hypothetical protein